MAFAGLVRLGQRHAGGGMLVAGIERVIRARDENLAPFQQARCEKTRDGADNDLLEERSMHFP